MSKMSRTIDQCLDELRQLRATLPSLVEHDPNTRAEIIREARRLIFDTESTMETVWRTGLDNGVEQTAIMIGVNMGLFSLLAKSREPLSAQNIAESCGAQEYFTNRILRALSALGVVQRHDGALKPLFTATPSTMKWATPQASNSIRIVYEYIMPALLEVPAELKNQSHTNIDTVHNGTFARAFNMPNACAWDVLGAKGFAEDFGYTMEFFGSMNQNWLDFYPFEERVLKGSASQDSAVFMVDVAGLTGIQSLNVRRRFPNAKGRFIVEDLQSQISPEHAKDLEYLHYDFFTPQPEEVHEARVYFMRYITHDWAQDKVIEICTNIRKAMKPGYSKLLIHDYIVPEVDPPQYMVTLDVVMMPFGGEERSLARHTDYIEKSGLKITGVYEPVDGVSLGIIECEVS